MTISLNPAELSAQGAPVDDLGQSAITRAVLNIYRNGSPVRFDHSGHEDPAGDLDLILVASEPSRTFYLTPGTYTTSASPGKMTIITSWPKVKC